MSKEIASLDKLAEFVSAGGGVALSGAGLSTDRRGSSRTKQERRSE